MRENKHDHRYPLLWSLSVVVVITHCHHCYPFSSSSSLFQSIIVGFKAAGSIKFISWVDERKMQENAWGGPPTSWVPPSISSSLTPPSSEKHPPTSLWKGEGQSPFCTC